MHQVMRIREKLTVMVLDVNIKDADVRIIILCGLVFQIEFQIWGVAAGVCDACSVENRAALENFRRADFESAGKPVALRRVRRN